MWRNHGQRGGGDRWFVFIIAVFFLLTYTITSIMNGIDYNDDYDNKDDDVMPSLLVFETQEFAWPHSNEISIYGDDEKSKGGGGWDFAISATGCQSVRKIVEKVQAQSASYHNFNT